MDWIVVHLLFGVPMHLFIKASNKKVEAEGTAVMSPDGLIDSPAIEASCGRLHCDLNIVRRHPQKKRHFNGSSKLVTVKVIGNFVAPVYWSLV